LTPSAGLFKKAGRQLIRQSRLFSFGGEWRESTVPLVVKGRILHLRLLLPGQRKPIDLDWIGVGPIGEKAKMANS